MKPLCTLLPMLLFALLSTAGDLTYDLQKMTEPPSYRAGDIRQVFTRSDQMIHMTVEAGTQQMDVPNKEVNVEAYTFTVVSVDSAGLPTQIERAYTRAYTRTNQQGMVLPPYHDNGLVFTRKDSAWDVTLKGKEQKLKAETKQALIKELVQLDEAYQIFLSLLPLKPVKLNESWPITGEAMKKLAYKLAGEGSGFQPDLQNSRFEARLETVTDKVFTLDITGKLYLSTQLQPGLHAMLEIDQKLKQVTRRGPYQAVLEELAGTAKLSGSGKQGQMDIIVHGGGFITAESRTLPVNEATRKAMATNKARQIDTVFEKLGFPDKIDEMVDRIGEAKTGMASILTEEQRKKFEAGIDASFTRENIAMDLRTFLAMEMDRAHEKELLAWLASDEGKGLMPKLRGLHLTANDPGFKTWTDTVTEDQLQDMLPRMSVLMKEMGALHEGLTAVVSVTGHLIDAVNVLQPGKFDDQQKQVVLHQARQSNARDLELGTLMVIAYQMRHVDQATYDRYLAWVQSAQGMWYRDLAGNAVLYAYARRFQAMLAILGR